MHSSIKKYSRSVIYNWVLSYVLIILVTVLLTGIVYAIAKRTIEYEINNSNKLLLENIRDNIDRTINEVNELSMEISSDPNIQSLLSSNMFDKTFPYTLYKAANSLRSYKIVRNSLQNYYIFSNELKIVMSPGTVNTIEDYYNNYIKSPGYTSEQWIETLSQVHRGDYFTMPYFEAGTVDKRGLALIRSLPVTSRDHASANIVIMIDLDNVLKYGNKDRNILILDSKNNIMAQSNTNEEYSDLNYKEMTGEHGILTKRLNNKKVVISYILSTQNDWKYIKITPQYVFWQKEQFIRNIMVGEILVFVFLIGFLSYYFVRKNYNPLKEVISYIREKFKSDSGNEINEFRYIIHVLSKTIDEKERFQLQLHRQKTALRTNFIISLLKGREIAVPINELITSYDIDFKNKYYSVAAIYIENIDENFWKPDNNESFDQYSLIKFIIKNVVEEVINRTSWCYMVDIDDILFCVINSKTQGHEFKTSIIEQINEAGNFISQKFKIDLIFAVSDIHNSINEIHEAYNEAINALEYARVLERGNTVFYNDIIVQKGINSYYSVEKENKLINFIKIIDQESAISVIEDIFINDLIKNSVSIEITRFLMMNLVGSIFRKLSDNEEELNRRFVENIIPASQLIKCNNLIEMKYKMVEIVKKICEFEKVRQESTDCRISDEIKKVVVENYNDPNLSINSIADIIGKSPYYISKIFKMQTGESILDFIRHVRIEKAKELLKKDAYNQEIIAERVGFTSVRTFQRTFKKLEGITPGKLRI